MPIYEYKCDDCGGVSEFLENYASKSPHSCEHCGGKNVHRVMSVFSAAMDGKSITGGSGSCSSCSSGSCSTCGL